MRVNCNVCILQKYAEETNGDYDGDSNSYDINVLLSGAKENLGIAGSILLRP